jgi:hypothetical protein
MKGREDLLAECNAEMFGGLAQCLVADGGGEPVQTLHTSYGLQPMCRISPRVTC